MQLDIFEVFKQYRGNISGKSSYDGVEQQLTDDVVSSSTDSGLKTNQI